MPPFLKSTYKYISKASKSILFFDSEIPIPAIHPKGTVRNKYENDCKWYLT